MITDEITQWPKIGDAESWITFHFTTDWAARRSVGSCYVRTPELVNGKGKGSVPAVDALGGFRKVPKVLGNLGALRGQATVTSHTGVVTKDETAAQPDPEPGFVWKCEVDRARSRILQTGGDMDPTTVVARGGRDCAAQAIVTDGRS